MAVLNAAGQNEAFDFRQSAEVDFSSFLTSASSFYDFNTVGAGYVQLDGSGFTRDGSNNPTSGTVNHVRIWSSTTPTHDVDITGLSITVTALVQPALDAEGFANQFWRVAMAGNDNITGGNFTFAMAGDGRHVVAGLSLLGGNDIMTGGNGAGGTSQFLWGDYHTIYGTAVGGNDVITANGASFTVISGDVALVGTGSTVVGGDDVLTMNGSTAANFAMGDAEAVQGTLIGGDDSITGSQQFDRLYGETQIFYSGVLIGGDDTIRGRGGDDLIYGESEHATAPFTIAGGNDRLFGDGGADQIWGNGGSDYIDGGDGSDTAFFSDIFTAGAAVTRVGGSVWVSQFAIGDVDTLVNVENIRLTATTVAVTTFNEFRGLEYAASFGDLIGAFRGASPDAINFAAAQHYANSGYFEGRFNEDTVRFDAQGYINNYADLAGVFGTGITLNANAAANHFIQSGFVEGRLGFDGLLYIASHADLAAALGANRATGVSHFQASGRAEGRGITFDVAQYQANYADLAALSATSATQHYLQSGRAEGRSDIDPLDYVASYDDLIQAFGDYGSAPNVTTLGLSHYTSGGGRAAGRAATFDALQYLENYQDLAQAYGNNVDAAATHFILYGFYEGRSDDNLFA